MRAVLTVLMGAIPILAARPSSPDLRPAVLCGQDRRCSGHWHSGRRGERRGRVLEGLGFAVERPNEHNRR